MYNISSRSQENLEIDIFLLTLNHTCQNMLMSCVCVISCEREFMICHIFVKATFQLSSMFHHTFLSRDYSNARKDKGSQNTVNFFHRKRVEFIDLRLFAFLWYDVILINYIHSWGYASSKQARECVNYIHTWTSLSIPISHVKLKSLENTHKISLEPSRSNIARAREIWFIKLKMFAFQTKTRQQTIHWFENMRERRDSI